MIWSLFICESHRPKGKLKGNLKRLDLNSPFKFTYEFMAARHIQRINSILFIQLILLNTLKTRRAN